MLLAVATFSDAGEVVSKWVTIPDARPLRPIRSAMSSSMRLLAKALSRIRKGSRETSMPAPNSMIWLEKSRACSSRAKLCASEPRYRARAAARARSHTGRGGGAFGPAPG